MVQEIASIIVVVGTMILFAFIAFSIGKNKWLKNMFFMFSLLLVPVALFISMQVANLNGLNSINSIMERLYGTFIILYMFLTFMFIVKFIMYMFNLFKIKRESEVDVSPEDI